MSSPETKISVNRFIGKTGIDVDFIKTPSIYIKEVSEHSSGMLEK